MSRQSGFFDSLRKSTKITVLSCGSFVVMTLLILTFFILFPITPSEKIMTNIGRGENMSQDDGQQSVQSGIPSVETTLSTASTTKATTTRATTTRARTSFTITLTTGSGFLWNGRIPTGGIPGYTETYTTPVDPNQGEPYVDPTQGEPYVDPTQGGTTPADPNQGGTTPADPNQGGTNPGDPNQGVVTPVDPNQGGTNPGDPNQGGTPDPGTGTW